MTVNGACCAIESCPCCPGCGCGGRRFTLSQPPFFSQPFFTVILYNSRGELSLSVQYMPEIPGDQSMIKQCETHQESAAAGFLQIDQISGTSCPTCTVMPNRGCVEKSGNCRITLLSSQDFPAHTLFYPVGLCSAVRSV